VTAQKRYLHCTFLSNAQIFEEHWENFYTDKMTQTDNKDLQEIYYTIVTLQFNRDLFLITVVFVGI
jgi:hypothetical protein